MSSLRSWLEPLSLVFVFVLAVRPETAQAVTLISVLPAQTSAASPRLKEAEVTALQVQSLPMDPLHPSVLLAHVFVSPVWSIVISEPTGVFGKVEQLSGVFSMTQARLDDGRHLVWRYTSAAPNRVVGVRDVRVSEDIRSLGYDYPLRPETALMTPDLGDCDLVDNQKIHFVDRFDFIGLCAPHNGPGTRIVVFSEDGDRSMTLGTHPLELRNIGVGNLLHGVGPITIYVLSAPDDQGRVRLMKYEWRPEAGARAPSSDDVWRASTRRW